MGANIPGVVAQVIQAIQAPQPQPGTLVAGAANIHDVLSGRGNGLQDFLAAWKLGPTHLTLNAGLDNQIAASGAAVANAIAVTVTKRRQFRGRPVSTPVAGLAVRFTIIEGNGQLTGASPVNGANGVATLGSWVLGDRGRNRLRVEIFGLPALVVTATAM